MGTEESMARDVGGGGSMELGTEAHLVKIKPESRTRTLVDPTGVHVLAPERRHQFPTGHRRR